MRRLLPIIGLLLTVGATAVVVGATDAYLNGTFVRQADWLQEERRGLDIPTAPGEASDRPAFEIWLHRGEALVDLTTIPDLASSDSNRPLVKSVRRIWSAGWQPLHTDESREASRSSRGTLWQPSGALDSQLRLAASFLEDRSRQRLSPQLAVRIYPDRDTPWWDVKRLVQHCDDAGLDFPQLALRTPDGEHADHAAQLICKELSDLHLGETEVWLSHRLGDLPTTRHRCSGERCAAAARALLTEAHVEASLCVTPSGPVRMHDIAAALTVAHELGIDATLTY